jgi:hypothetical protein
MRRGYSIQNKKGKETMSVCACVHPGFFRRATKCNGLTFGVALEETILQSVGIFLFQFLSL